MTLKPEVLAALDRIEYVKILGFDADWKTVGDELLAMDAEIVSLRKIEEERWSVVATRNAAVMRAEKAEALLRDMRDGAFNIGGWSDAIDEYFDAHLSENEHG